MCLGTWKSGLTRPITDDQMTKLVRLSEKAEAEGLSIPSTRPSAVIEFAARTSETLLLQWDWLDLPNGRWSGRTARPAICPSSPERRGSPPLESAPHHGDSPFTFAPRDPITKPPSPTPTIRRGGASLTVLVC